MWAGRARPRSGCSLSTKLPAAGASRACSWTPARPSPGTRASPPWSCPPSPTCTRRTGCISAGATSGSPAGTGRRAGSASWCSGCSSEKREIGRDGGIEVTDVADVAIGPDDDPSSGPQTVPGGHDAVRVGDRGVVPVDLPAGGGCDEHLPGAVGVLDRLWRLAGGGDADDDVPAEAGRPGRRQLILHGRVGHAGGVVARCHPRMAMVAGDDGAATVGKLDLLKLAGDGVPDRRQARGRMDKLVSELDRQLVAQGADLREARGELDDLRRDRMPLGLVAV